MNLISSDNFKAVVRFIYIIIIALTLAYATAYAADKKKASAEPAGSSTSSYMPAPGYSVCAGLKDQALYECISASKEAESRGGNCEAQKQKLRENMEEMGKVCSLDSLGEANSSGNNGKCAQKYKDCLKTPTTQAAANGVLAQIFSTPTIELKRNCIEKPSSYFSRRKEIEDKIESLGKDIRNLEKEDSEIDRDYQKEIKALQEEFAKEQKDLDNLQEEIDDKNMEEERAALDEDQKAAKNLSQLLQSKMELRNDLSTATVKAQGAMLEASDEISRGDCIRQVKKFKAENAPALKAKSAGDLIGGANSIKKQLEARFDACMQIMTLRRQEIGRELSEKVAAITFKLDENARQIQQLEDFNKQSSQQREKRTQLMADKKQKAIKASVQKTQQIQAQLVQEGEMAKKKHASTQRALLDTTQMKNKMNAKLISLGAQDDSQSSSSDKSTMDEIKTYNTYVINFKNFNESSCCSKDGARDSFCETAGNIGKSGTIPTDGRK